MVTLGLDPGVKNCAYCVFDGSKVLESGMLDHKITDLKTPGLRPKLVAFLKVIRRLVNKYQIQQVTAERFISRGLRGSQGEIISMMLSLLVYHYDCRLLLSSTWKNHVNKQFDLDSCYKAYGLVPHIIDALMICLYTQDLEVCTLRQRKAEKQQAKLRKAKVRKTGKITNQKVVKERPIKIEGPGLLLSDRKVILSLMKELERCHRSRNPRNQPQLLKTFKQSFVL